MRTTKRAIEAMTLLLLANGKAESMHENPHEHRVDPRAFWDQFLDSLLGPSRMFGSLGRVESGGASSETTIERWSNSPTETSDSDPRSSHSSGPASGGASSAPSP